MAARTKVGMSNNIEGANMDTIPINEERGDPILPSVVTIQTNGDSPFVGNAAVRRHYTDPLLTLYDSKRMLGM